MALAALTLVYLNEKSTKEQHILNFKIFCHRPLVVVSTETLIKVLPFFEAKCV